MASLWDLQDPQDHTRATCFSTGVRSGRVGLLLVQEVLGRELWRISVCTPVPAMLRGQLLGGPFDAQSLGFPDSVWEFA